VKDSLGFEIVDSFELTTGEDVTFEQTHSSGARHWSKVMMDGVCIGSMLERERGLLAPIEVVFYKEVPESIDLDPFIRWGDSESKGFKTAIFDKLQHLVNFHHWVAKQPCALIL
jgi:hypothetical protein